LPLGHNAQVVVLGPGHHLADGHDYRSRNPSGSI
jgi:hypothetical protein